MTVEQFDHLLHLVSAGFVVCLFALGYLAGEKT